MENAADSLVEWVDGEIVVPDGYVRATTPGPNILCAWNTCPVSDSWDQVSETSQVYSDRLIFIAPIPEVVVEAPFKSVN